MLLVTPHLLGLAGLLAGMWLWQRRRGVSFWEPGQLMLWISLASMLLHLQFASVGWFFRYEAYLMALGVTALLCNRCDVAVWDWFGQSGRGLLVRKGAVAVAVFLAMAPMAQRSAAALAGFPVASHNIYQQQYQMARFLKTYYEGSSVAANDVGAINYMADLRCVDLVGLCNRDVYR